MTKISIFDIKPAAAGRSLQTGDNSAAYFKNVCYGCRKPFNKRKGRQRSMPVMFTNGQQGFMCRRCLETVKSSAQSLGTLAL